MRFHLLLFQRHLMMFKHGVYYLPKLPHISKKKDNSLQDIVTV